jgi:hypothetical protein
VGGLDNASHLLYTRLTDHLFKERIQLGQPFLRIGYADRPASSSTNASSFWSAQSTPA